MRGGLVGDAQAVDELRFDAQRLQHLADLRAAAMHHHRIDADSLQQHDILCEIMLQFGVAHGVAAVFHHKGPPFIPFEVGQRLDQRFGLGEQLGIVRIGHGALFNRLRYDVKRF